LLGRAIGGRHCDIKWMGGEFETIEFGDDSDRYLGEMSSILSFLFTRNYCPDY
jgi:hypothetical protein